jgi:glycosyltransferase involved in cell wall biosynthesis
MLSESQASPADVEISVIVPSFRSRGTIAETLESILSQDFSGTSEVLVIDSSDDGTAEWIREHFPQVKVHHSEERLLPGAARNVGVQKSRGRLLAFIDADARAAANWLSSLRARLVDDPAIVMVGAAVANANPETAASRTLYWLEFSEFLPDQAAGYRPLLSSSNLLIRREDFLAAEGFKPDFAMAEDLVLCLMIGRGLYLETSTRIFHRHRTDWTRVREHLYRLGLWSGRFRATFPVRGSGLRRLPILCFTLTPWRLVQVTRRVWKHDRAWLRLARAIPWLISGLWIWNRGFYRGLRLAHDQDACDLAAPGRR